MTDRLYSCKESPNGKHVISTVTRGCCYCHRTLIRRIHALRASASALSPEPACDVRAHMETWLAQLEEWAVVERVDGQACRWCAVQRGFHHRGCPIEALVTGVRTYTRALRRSGLVEMPPLPEVAALSPSSSPSTSNP